MKNTEEKEYIVLNRAEDAEEQETGVRREGSQLELSGYRYFDCEAVQKSMHVTTAEMKKAKRILDQKLVTCTDIDAGYGDGADGMVCEAFGDATEGRNVFPVHMVFDRNKILFAECNCSECRKHFYYRYYRREYCSYLIAFSEVVKEELKQKNLGDATDRLAARLMNAFSEKRANSVVSDAVGREGSLTLQPRLCKKKGELTASFKVGEKKLFVVKDLFRFVEDVQESRSSVYGSGTQINHRLENFTEDGKTWIAFIGQVIKEEQNFTRRLAEADIYSSKATAKSGELALSGWRLDEFYRLMGDCSIEYEDRDTEKKEKRQLSAIERNPKITMTIRKNKLSSRREFHGIEVDCRMPQIY